MQAARGTSLNPGDTTPTSVPAPTGKLRLRAIFVATAVSFWAIDVVTKLVAVDQLTGRGRVDVLGDAFGFHLTRNAGAAFSTGTAFTEVFSLLAIVASGVVIWLSRRLGSSFWAFGLGILLAGITGNLTDRIFRAPGFLQGQVVDFLELPHWPIFNGADMMLNIGVGVVLVQAVRGIRIDGSRHAGAS
jgi:signal peptidase II